MVCRCHPVDLAGSDLLADRQPTNLASGNTAATQLQKSCDLTSCWFRLQRPCILHLELPHLFWPQHGASLRFPQRLLRRRHLGIGSGTNLGAELWGTLPTRQPRSIPVLPTHPPSSPSRRPSQTPQGPKNTANTRPRSATAARGAACCQFQEPRLGKGKRQGTPGEMSCTTAAPTPHAQDD